MLEKAIIEFKKYTSSYITEENKMYQLKIDHTLRVMDLCGEIAKNLNLDEEKIEIAKMCGLLHDIGRFEQMKRYGTFADKKSIDHGNLGKEILLEHNFIRKFISNSNLDSIILDAVEFHNKLVDPETISDDNKLFLNITRDADKIDILYLVESEEVTIDIKDFTISYVVYDTILNNKMVLHKDVKTKVDSVCMWLGFIYGFNYSYSLELLKEKDYIPEIIEHYQNKTTNIKTKEQFEELKQHIINYKKEEDMSC